MLIIEQSRPHCHGGFRLMNLDSASCAGLWQLVLELCNIVINSSLLVVASKIMRRVWVLHEETGVGRGGPVG